MDTKNIELKIEKKRLNGKICIQHEHSQINKNESQIILDALKKPIGSQTLAQLAVNKKNIVIVTSDHTRAVPSSITMPLIFKRN